MNQTERVMLVDRMKFLVSELDRLENYCPQKPVAPGPCFKLKCKLPRCRSNPDLEPLITWTPVMEVRRTTNLKALKHPSENPLVKHVYVDPMQRTLVCGAMDPCMRVCADRQDGMTPSLSRDRSSAYHGPGKCFPGPNDGRHVPKISHTGSTKCTPALRDVEIELCCPTFGPPMDSCGQSYHCQVTLDGRTVCKPTDDMPTRPQIGCDRKQLQSRFPDCEEKHIGVKFSTSPRQYRVPSTPNASKRQGINIGIKSSTPCRTSPGRDKRHYHSGDVCICCACSKQTY